MIRRIGLDVMGGDFAPEAAVKGAVMALDAVGEGTTIVLYGNREEIVKLLSADGVSADRFDIVNTSEVIEMHDHPVQAFVGKPDSSVAVGFKHLAEGKIDSFASAGNTGAMMVGSMQVIKPLEGILRPAISVPLATTDGGSVVLLDVGLNSDCRPEILAQYGVIGSAYSNSVLKVENPRVALLNIGEEPSKGNIAAKAAHEFMAADETINFVGNVEAKYIFTGKHADVVVCDGFVGNSLLKLAEGFYEIARDQGIFGSYVDNLNYERVGGTAVLGIGANVMVGHGVSSPLAFKNMILSSERNVKGKLVKKLQEIFGK